MAKQKKLQKTQSQSLANKSKQIKKKKTSKAITKKPTVTKAKKSNSIPLGKDRSRFKTAKYQNANTIKEKMEALYTPLCNKYVKMTKDEIDKDVEENQFSAYQRNQIGTVLHGILKKLSQIGIDGPNLTYCYTPAQLLKYNGILNSLETVTVKDLQDELKKNYQPTTDIKQNLIHRIADGRVLGQIPKCPQCFGGRLKFNNKTGVYRCPGYSDGGDNCFKADDYVFCNGSFNLNEIKREDWV